MVIPSRTDAFNLVAMEALAHGAPIVLSRHAGAADFLRLEWPHIAPPVIDPEDTGAAAAALTAILVDYPARALQLRRNLRERPMPRPSNDFLAPYWISPVANPPGIVDTALSGQLRTADPLASDAAMAWRANPRLEGELSAVVVVRDNSEGLYRTLAALGRQGRQLGQILVVDDGSAQPPCIAGDGSRVRVVRHGTRGLAESLNRGCAEAMFDLVQLFVAGDQPESDCVASAWAERTGIEDGSADAVSLPWDWLERAESAPADTPGTSGWLAPGLLCNRRGLLAGGGFCGMPGGTEVSPPRVTRLLRISGTDPVVWRERNATAPWRSPAKGTRILH